MATQSKNINQIGEFGFIETIRQACIATPERVVCGIGDDAAVFEPFQDKLSLISTDLLIEGVHFIRTAMTGFELGHKALAVNLSDIAAMGGLAEHAFVALAIPHTCPVDYLVDLYAGIKRLAARFGVNILGGDTTASNNDLVINITVYGSIAEKELLTRNAARPGDLIYISGPVGLSKAGLYLIQQGIECDSTEFQILKRAHTLPMPRLTEGRFFATQKGCRAAMDISDGLASDIKQISAASKVGIRLYADKLPIPPNLAFFCRRFKIDPIPFIISGGEDYELICTIAPDNAEQIAESYAQLFEKPLYCIGEITEAADRWLIQPDGTPIAFSSIPSWNHFNEMVKK